MYVHGVFKETESWANSLISNPVEAKKFEMYVDLLTLCFDAVYGFVVTLMHDDFFNKGMQHLAGQGWG